MPTTITIQDPRPRTREIFLDLSNPNRYVITIVRETVKEVAEDGTIFSRNTTRKIRRVVTFDPVTEAPSGDADIVELLMPIKAIVERLEAEDIAAEAAREAAANAGNHG